MKEVFSTTNFPIATGRNIYHWKEVNTDFEVENNGKYIVAITATSKNAKQNNSHDDDDLRVIIDDYEFGKYEIHDEKISWKGFGTSSSWNGASLQGEAKTIYFFLELQKGKHNLKFYADNTPQLKEIRVLELKENEDFEINNVKPNTNFKTDKKGIPFLNFVFLGVKPKNFQVTSICNSASQKKSTDGDNLKVVVNGKILQNLKTPTSDKYKNFYFSGDLNKGKKEMLKIEPKDFEFIEDSIELWYDENPEISVNVELFDSLHFWKETELTEKGKYIFYENVLKYLVAKGWFAVNKWKYSKQLLEHSLLDNPNTLIFNNEDQFTIQIKKDKEYQKIINIITDQLKLEILSGQINLGNQKKNQDIAFQNKDLANSLHGIKKIVWNAVFDKNTNLYEVSFILFDVYDFDANKYDFSAKWIGVYMADILEAVQILKNYEIQINIKEIIKL
jgi:hypothetical protein